MPKMNVSVLAIMDYGKNSTFAKNKNKAKSKPNKANFEKWLN